MSRKKNPALAELSVADATGRLMLDSNKFETAAKDGAARMTPETLNQYKETATREQQEAFARDLGYGSLEEFYVDSFEGVQARLEQYLYDHQEEISARVRRKSMAKTAKSNNAKTLPKKIKSNLADGVYVFAEAGEHFAVIKEGQSYWIYNYVTEMISHEMTLPEINGIIEKLRSKLSENTSLDKVIEEYRNAPVNKEILELIERVEKDDFKDNDKVELRGLSSEVLSKLKELTGIDVSSFKIAIEARQIEHILNDHGSNGSTDHSMANPVDIAKMEYIMQYPDDLSLSGKTQAYSYMKNGRNRTADTVLYEKEIGDKSYYVVQAVADTKKKTLYIVSAFIGEKGYKKGTSQLINTNKGPDATSELGSVVVPNSSIPQNSENSNTFDENISEDVVNLSENTNLAEKKAYEMEFPAEKVQENVANNPCQTILKMI